MSNHEPGPSVPQVVNVALAVVVGLSVVGFVFGIRPADSSAGLGLSQIPSARGVVPSQPYRALRNRSLGRSALVTSDLDRLRSHIPAVTAKVPPQTEQQKKEALAARAARRAFDGAPPTLPHPVDQQSAEGSLACHEMGIRLKGRIAPVMSHKAYASCTQCHTAAVNGQAGAVQVPSSFSGLASPGKGDRAWPGAPPLIPHTTQMREACAACHGVNGRPGLRTSHPERQNCVQCHVPR